MLEEGFLATFSVRPVGASSSLGWTGMVLAAVNFLLCGFGEDVSAFCNMGGKEG